MPTIKNPQTNQKTLLLNYLYDFEEVINSTTTEKHNVYTRSVTMFSEINADIGI